MTGLSIKMTCRAGRNRPKIDLSIQHEKARLSEAGFFCGVHAKRDFSAVSGSVLDGFHSA